MSGHTMHSTYAWQVLSRKRIAIGRANQEPCGMCHTPIDYNLSGKHRDGPTSDHPTPLAWGGDLLPPIDELRVVHRRCNARQGARIKNARAKRPKGKSGSFGGPTPTLPAQGVDTSPVLSELDRDPRGTPDDWARFDVPWLRDLVPPPDGVAWPRHMSSPHPRAVGSLGAEIEAWARAEFGIELRWWQRLAMRRQYEVDADGRLVWFTVIESAPRRSGKSLRIRTSALWRCQQEARFGEPQLVLLTGKDLPILKEIHRRSWRWAEDRGDTVRQQNGHEEVDHAGNRWLVRSMFGVFGYDVTYGQCDESWAVPATAVDDGLEPALLERVQPQLLLTSTGHPKATPMMLVRRKAAIAEEFAPVDTLILDWGAPDGVPVADRRGWRLASPHWTPERERLMASALRRLQEGKDIDPDGLDPETSFAAQYLNRWPGQKKAEKRWLPSAQVEGCAVEAVDVAGGLVGAIEVSLDGSQWSAAVCDGHRARMCVGKPLSAVLAWLDGQGVAEVVAHQATMSRLPDSWPLRAVTVGEACAAVQVLADAVRDGEVVWDCGEQMAVQFGRVVTAPGPAGPRIADRLSRGSVEAVKALSWALWRATTNAPEAPAVW